MSEKIVNYQDLPIPKNSFLSTQNRLQISMNGKKVSNEEVQIVSQSLQNCINLQSLILNFKQCKTIGENIFSCLGPALATCTKLAQFSINFNNSNNIDSSLFQNLGIGFVSCTNLSIVTINLNNVKQINPKYLYSLGFAIGQCNSLTQLTIDLSNNKLSDDTILSILGTNLASLINLSRLSISLKNNKFGINGVSSFVSSLVNCVNLTSLFLQLQTNNSFGQGTLDFGSGFYNLTSLEFFIGGSTFYEYIELGLFNGLSSCINLQDLNLQLYGLSKQDSMYLISSLRSIPKLQKFIGNFQSYQYDEEFAQYIGSELGSYQKLEYLDLEYNFKVNFEKSIINLSSGLSNCPNLSILKLQLGGSNDEVRYETTSAFTQNLANCPKLSDLQLHIWTHNDHKLADESVKGLGFGLANCNNLITLKLNLNNKRIGSQGISGLFSSLEKCQKLSILNVNLSWNKICFEGVKSIGVSLTKCKNLTCLQLNLQQINDEDNQLDEDNKQYFKRIVNKIKRLVKQSLKF
ncbi:hypothetical protein TTHERM_01550950 (macronuclear) [Tetrahymena thermophila SB210]|uniref:Kinase domain protein n=1 Tax=Tetrahymena thermophila (strain SB210) TaxID=312017 RepID=Q232B0_TETTS|nr:hypothetical protein TTHERM_01550950 [Tetrahymena thermophila SB210]EAR91363.2 hypothetical protein TTHERM_01550950 [Tetrahymena thermophila SB210]|eukprot:XP_001011608.2 hypothetical protein TTHERM_01550950 [Tetrahymena thermophila SB210]